MRYALNLAEDNRVLSATYEKYGAPDAIFVDELPDGNIADYLYQAGEYVYAPLPETEPAEHAPTQLDLIEAQVTYTAMMTDTLLEV